MNPYRNLSAREAAEILKSLKAPVVLMHARPDGDTAGSCAALIKILRALGIEAQYASADKIPDRLAFLLEGEKQAEVLDGRELIAIDVASPSQLGSLSYLADKVILTIDHHRVNSPFSDNLTLPDASSAAEALSAVLDELIKDGKCSLTPEIAHPMYAAISSDTGGFLFSSASAQTYRLAARLIDTGIDFADINHALFHSKSREQLLAEGFISSRIRTAANGKIAYAALSAADRAALSLSGEHFETAIDIIRSLIFSEIALFVRENDDGSIKASLRSTGFDVASVAANFGGGGHIRAAGCTLSANNAEEGAALLVEAIEKRL